MQYFLEGHLRIQPRQPQHPDPPEKGAEENADPVFPEPEGYLMIFGGPWAYEPQHHQKLLWREVNFADPTVPSYLK